MNFSPLFRQQSCQDTPEPVTDFVQCVFSLLSRIAYAHPSCIALSVTFGAFVTNGFLYDDFLADMDWTMSIFCFLSCHLFSFSRHSDTVLVGVDQSLLLIPWH